MVCFPGDGRSGGLKLFAVMAGFRFRTYACRALSARTAVHIRKGARWAPRIPGPPSRTVQLPDEVPSSDDRTGISSNEESTTQQ